MDSKVSNATAVTMIQTKVRKVAPKPRLVARSNEPKSPWKYHKVPIVTSHGLSAEMKPLFSSILWRLYECDNNPLMPEHYELFTGTNAMLAAAERLEIPVTTPLRVRSYLHEIKLENDHRLQSGELEANFPESFTLNNATNHTHVADPTTQAVNGDAIPGIPSESPESMEKDEKEQEEIGAEESLDVALRSEGTDQADNIPANGTNEDGALKSEDTSLSTVNVPKAEPMEDLVEDVGQSRQENESHAQIVALKSTIGGNELDPKSLSPSSSPSTANAEPKSKDSDPDSDEEIIVFNPRARRASGKKHKDGSRSRPTTSSGAAPKMLKTSPKESSVRPATSVGKTSTTEKDGTGPVTLTNDNDLLAEDSKVQAAAEKLKLKIGSTLKPESPIFTPGKPFIPTLQQPTSQLRYEAPADPASVSPPKSPVFLAKARSDTPRHPRAAMQQRQSSQEQIRLQRENQQRESEKMIQRQREAIQRRAKIEEKPPKKMAETVEQKPAEKPPPRQIQMEPTNNPTVIDPDAFDRSYIVQAPSSSPTTNSSGEKKRPRSHQPRGGATKRNQGSPKRNSKTPEPEVEFVLKSGAPRGSARGKGKLWVP